MQSIMIIYCASVMLHTATVSTLETTDFACKMAEARVHKDLSTQCDIICQPTDLRKE